MPFHQASFALICLAGTAVTSIVAQLTLAAPATLTVEEVRKIGTDRQEMIRNMRVVYTVSWKKLEDAPSTETLALEPSRIAFALDGSRRYLKWTPTRAGQAETAISFDGRYSMEYSLGVAMVVSGKEQRTEAYEMYCRNFLDIPHSDRDIANRDVLLLYPRCLRPIEKSFLDKVLQGTKLWGAKLSKRKTPPIPKAGQSAYRMLPDQDRVDGVLCHVIEYPGRDRIWVDPKLGCAIRKRARFRYAENGDEVPTHRYRMKRYSEVINGLWLPLDCLLTRYGTGRDPVALHNKPVLEMRVVVDEIRVNDVSDDDFAIEIAPGSTIVTESDSFMLRGTDAAVLTEFSQVAKEAFAQGEVMRRRSTWIWIGLNVTILLVLVALFFAGRRWMSARRGVRAR